MVHLSPELQAIVRLEHEMDDMRRSLRIIEAHFARDRRDKEEKMLKEHLIKKGKVPQRPEEDKSEYDPMKDLLSTDYYIPTSWNELITHPDATVPPEWVVGQIFYLNLWGFLGDLPGVPEFFGYIRGRQERRKMGKREPVVVIQEGEKAGARAGAPAYVGAGLFLPPYGAVGIEAADPNLIVTADALVRGLDTMYRLSTDRDLMVNTQLDARMGNEKAKDILEDILNYRVHKQRDENMFRLETQKNWNELALKMRELDYRHKTE